MCLVKIKCPADHPQLKPVTHGEYLEVALRSSKNFYGKNIESCTAIVGKNGSGKSTFCNFHSYVFNKVKERKSKTFDKIYTYNGNSLVAFSYCLNTKMPRFILQLDYYYRIFLGELENELSILSSLRVSNDTEFYLSFEVNKLNLNISYIRNFLELKDSKIHGYFFLVCILLDYYDLLATYSTHKNKEIPNVEIEYDSYKGKDEIVGYIINNFSDSSKLELLYTELINNLGDLMPKVFSNLEFYDDNFKELILDEFDNIYKKSDRFIDKNRLYCVKRSQIVEENIDLSIISSIIKIFNHNYTVDFHASLVFSYTHVPLRVALSAGQIQILDLFISIRSLLLHQSGSDISNFIIFLDEPDLHLHPEWQRKFMKHLLDFLNQDVFKDYKFQIIIATHSPLLLSDFPAEDIVYLGDQGRELNNNKPKTFGANIHDLYKHSFFLDNTMGEFALDKVKDVVAFLEGKKKRIVIGVKDKETKIDVKITSREEALQIIEMIGEPILKNKLYDMYRQKFEKTRLEDFSKEELIRYIKRNRA